MQPFNMITVELQFDGVINAVILINQYHREQANFK